MALYTVKDKATGKVRLVEGPSKEAALKHVASSLFEIETLSKPSDTAKLMASGVKLETAGEEPAPPPAGDEGQQ